MLDRPYSNDGTKSYCLSVGTFYNYDEMLPEAPYTILCKNAYEENVRYEHITLSKFFIWAAAHQSILEQEEMFQHAHAMYLKHKKEYPEIPNGDYTPLLYAARELEEKELLFVSEEYEPELSKQEVCNIIYPALVTTRAKNRLHLQPGFMSGIKNFLNVCLLKGNQKSIYEYLKNTPEADFWGYHLSCLQKKTGSSEFIPMMGDDVSALLEKGLVLAMGWTIPLHG